MKLRDQDKFLLKLYSLPKNDNEEYKWVWFRNHYKLIKVIK